MLSRTAKIVIGGIIIYVSLMAAEVFWLIPEAGRILKLGSLWISITATGIIITTAILVFLLMLLLDSKENRPKSDKINRQE